MQRVRSETLDKSAAVRVLTGDCRKLLRSLPARSVHCVVTSPPYWGLRDYGTGEWVGGDPKHKHDRVGARGGRGGSGAPGKQTAGAFPSTVPATVCSCGARRLDIQLGLEPTPEAYVAELVAVFREVRRVLRGDGTVWLVLGDSYSSGGRESQVRDTLRDRATGKHAHFGVAVRPGNFEGAKPKNLIGIPWRVAFALQADGWYLRQDIVWHKPNPMPESVTDRCTKAHEYVFLLSKSQSYYYDAAAIAEPVIKGAAGSTFNSGKTAGHQLDRSSVERVEDGTRNKRSVWTIASQPFPGAHFAVFPPALVKPCIKAGCPVGGMVLDPFAGAGTTGLVAKRLGRRAILMEANPAYARMAARRIEGDAPLFRIKVATVVERAPTLVEAVR